MNNRQEKIVEILIKRGKELLNQPYRKIEFTGNPEADDLLKRTLKNPPLPGPIKLTGKSKIFLDEAHPPHKGDATT